MQGFLRFFGHGFCHQIPARSFEAGGLVFSVCARDTGIYLGFAFALVAAFIVYARAKGKPTELPPPACLVALALLVLPMALDGTTSYLGLRPTTNTIRYVTGFLAGTAAGTVIVPLLFALRTDAAPGRRMLARPGAAVLHLALAFALGAAFLVGYPLLGVAAPLLVVAAFFTITVCVNLILLTLTRRFAVRHTVAHWLLLLALCSALALVEIALFGAIRDAVVQLLLSGHEFSEFLT